MIRTLNLSLKQKVYLTALLWLAALILIIVFIASPLVYQIKRDGLELVQKKQEMESFYSDWQAVAQSQKDYQTRQNELNAWPAFLAPSEALKFIVLMEKFAQATNNSQTVTVSDPKQVDASTPSKTPSATEFQVSLRGNFPNLIKFLVYLENAPYYNKVQSLRVQRLTTKESENVNTGEINSILTISLFQ